MPELTRLNVQHYTRAEVEEYVRQARDVVEELVPVELRSDVLMVKVLELLANRTVSLTQAAPAGIDPSMFDPRLARKLGR